MAAQKIFRSETGYTVPPMHWYHMSVCTCVLSKRHTPIGSFWLILIDFMVWADYWLTDHPELRRTTQASTMGGPLGEPGFCIFRSTGNSAVFSHSLFKLTTKKTRRFRITTLCVRGTTTERRIPITKGQWCGKYFLWHDITMCADGTNFKFFLALWRLYASKNWLLNVDFRFIHIKPLSKDWYYQESPLA